MKNYAVVPEIPINKLISWWEKGKNVLLIGDHGVGKTSIIRGFWDSLGIKHAIFSGATLDPWTDLVGIPRPLEKEGKMYIDYVLPQTISNDVEAIYIDEINRSHPKVRNALLELIQFKSINGRKFPKLRVVWAAANPPDTEFNYDVEELDPAQEDRFHVIVKLGNRPNFEYFEKKFGKRLASSAISWWSAQDSVIQGFVSPRRLDYAVEYFVEGGDVRDILPYKEINISAFKRTLQDNKALDKFKKIFAESNSDAAKTFLSDAANWQDVYKDVLDNFSWADFAIKCMHPELVASVACSDTRFASLLAHYQKSDKGLRGVVSEIQKTGANTEWLSNALLAEKESSLPKSIEDIFDGINESVLDAGGPVPELSNRLAMESVEDTLESIECGVTDPFPVFDTTSALNILKFLDKAWQMKLLDPDDENKKVTKILCGALYALYSENGTMLQAVYYTSSKFMNKFAYRVAGSIKKVNVGDRHISFPSISGFGKKSKTKIKPMTL